MERVAVSFALKNTQYLIYNHLHPIYTYITHDSNPKIFDVSLAMMCRMGKRPSLFGFDS
jgi:hypothetical protein